MALEPITRQEKIIAGQDLKPITRMEKFLKEFGGSGGGGAQPDWNAAEGEPGHILNRPFGESTEVLFDQRAEFGEEGTSAISVPLGLEAGGQYKATLNGEVFDCIANIEAEDGTPVGISIETPFDSRYWFKIIEVYPEIAEAMGLPANVIISASLYNVSAPVKIEKSVIHTIDPKFLPGGGGGGVVIVQDSAMASGVMPAAQAAPTATMNASQIAEAVLSGKTVYFIEPNNQTLLPFVYGYRFGEMASGVMAAASAPDPFALFGSVDEEGWYVGVKVVLDGSYYTFDYGIKI